ncbi:hypothetical protein SLITO_v1c04130 [Spiroplasma litorale]|uniref:Transmembrane protein n=1 Tax=Spiroplasma litorale TaxID=216942 RepID=A0A0K1W1K6_9MOLU|nr:hypothetical protein [Spiroplasma litorale]AKX34066.1 hypothetical protein SLITO_v1c04130 [Spiroplasma litorale]
MNSGKLIILSSSAFIALVGFIELLITLFLGGKLSVVIPLVIGGLLIITAAMVNILFCFRQVVKIKASLILSFVYTIVVLILFITYPLVVDFSMNTIYVYSTILVFTIIFFTVLVITNFSERIKGLEY